MDSVRAVQPYSVWLRLSARNWRTAIEPHELHSDEVLAALAEKRFDLASRPMVTGRWMLVPPEAHLLAAGEAVCAGPLAGERLVLMERIRQW